MRIWHKDLIQYLPRKQLISQWRECCAIMGGIAKNGKVDHPLVRKVMDYPMNEFWYYATKVYAELKVRGYEPRWQAFAGPYGKVTGGWFEIPPTLFEDWHNERYMTQCYFNLEEKFDCGVITESEFRLVKYGAGVDKWDGC